MTLSLERKKEMGYSKFEANVVLKVEIHTVDESKVNFFWRDALSRFQKSFDGVEVSIEPMWVKSELE